MMPRSLKHDEDCVKQTTGYYTIGCVGCIHDLILDSKVALTKQIADMEKTPTMDEKQLFIDKLSFIMHMEKSMP